MTAVDPGHVATLRMLVSHSALWATIHAVTRGSLTVIPSWPATTRVTAPNAAAATAPPIPCTAARAAGESRGQDAGSPELVQSWLCADGEPGSAGRLPQSCPQDIDAEEQDPGGEQQFRPGSQAHADQQDDGDGESGQPDPPRDHLRAERNGCRADGEHRGHPHRVHVQQEPRDRYRLLFPCRRRFAPATRGRLLVVRGEHSGADHDLAHAGIVTRGLLQHLTRPAVISGGQDVVIARRPARENDGRRCRPW